jgi:hypothetical protein
VRAYAAGGTAGAWCPGEMETEVVCGPLPSTGIECGHRVTEATDFTLEGIASDGPREILVYETELEAARVLIADAQR